MKNLKKISLFLLLPLLCLVSCNDDSNFDGEEPTFGWVVFSRAETTVAVTPRTTSFTIPISFTAPINKEDLDITYSVIPVSGNPSEIVNGLGNSLTIEANTNTGGITLTPVDGAVQNLIDNGDVVFQIELTSASRDIAIGIDETSTVVHTVNLLCGGEPLPGSYVVDMEDSFGDGWQTDNGNGGSGITVTLTDVEGNESVIEFGMCSPYTAAAGTFLVDGACTAGTTSATTTVVIPDGTVNAVWVFPGDFYGEIGFTITNPNGAVLFSASPGDLETSSLELPISYCI